MMKGLLVIFFMAQSCHSISLKDEQLLTDEQREGFERFKALAIPLITAEYMKKEIVLLKYYRYCDMNENKTMDLLRENLKFRLDWGFDALTEDEVNDFSRNYPGTFFYDKLGRNYFFIPGKYWDIAAASSTPESSKKFILFMYHLYDDAYRKGVRNTTNRVACGTAVLFDLKGTELMKHLCPRCIDLLKTIFADLGRRWPGGLQIAYLVNVQSVLLPGINLIKATMPENEQKIIFAFDEDDAVWMPELLKTIAPEKIPQDIWIRSQQQKLGGAGGAGGSGPPAPPQPGMFAQALSGGPRGLLGGGNEDGQAAAAPEDGAKAKKQKKSNKKKKSDDDDDDDE